MKNKMLVARLSCGCVASTYFEDKDNPNAVGAAILEWLRDGYTVRYEERDSISAEKCLTHDKQGGKP